MTRQKQAERDEAKAKLISYLKPGDTVYTILRHVSRSGMQRSISVIKVIENDSECAERQIPIVLDYWIARVLGYRFDYKNGGLKIGGCGMDMGFHLVDGLGLALGFVGSNGCGEIVQRWL